MKIRMKSMLALVVAVSLVFAFSTPAMAAEDPRGSTVYAAQVILHSASGHSFITFENLTTLPLTIGVYTVQGGESITIGTWSARFGRSAGGVWYNLESYYLSEGYNFGDTLVSATASFQLDELSALVSRMTNFILSHDSHNSNYLCSNFALGLWNTAVEESLSIANRNDPQCLMEKMMEEYNYQTGYQYIPSLGSSKVGYAVNNSFNQVNMTAYLSELTNLEETVCVINSG